MLLVEDIELNVIVARSVLEKLGNSVDVAMTGKAALEMFEPGEYDLVLLDIQLPDMTGLDISRELKQRFAADELPPLVALTANVLKNKKEYLDAGMDDVLSKPLSVPALTAMIKKFWDAPDEEAQEAPHGPICIKPTRCWIPICWSNISSWWDRSLSTMVSRCLRR